MEQLAKRKIQPQEPVMVPFGGPVVEKKGHVVGEYESSQKNVPIKLELATEEDQILKDIEMRWDYEKTLLVDDFTDGRKLPIRREELDALRKGIETHLKDHKATIIAYTADQIRQAKKGAEMKKVNMDKYLRDNIAASIRMYSLPQDRMRAERDAILEQHKVNGAKRRKEELENRASL